MGELAIAAKPNTVSTTKVAEKKSASDTINQGNTGVGLIARKASCACGGSCPKCKAAANGIKVSQPNDPAEIEADQIADTIMRKPLRDTISVADQKNDGSAIQRKCKSCEDDEKKIQRKPLSLVNDSTAQNTTQIKTAISSGGRPFDEGTRNFFETRFNRDLGNVRIHTDSTANNSAREIDAKAYTLGNNIVFGAGEYQPGLESGRHLIAHELAHVMQQQRSTPALQRKADPGGGAFESAGAKNSNSSATDPPFRGAQFEQRPNDPPCSQTSAGLGKKLPEIDCDETNEDIGLIGTHFHFCIGSDVFAVPETPTALLKFARKQPAQSQFKVHGYASVDGQADDNIRLSCHRAMRVARELMNAGVLAENIEVARKGATEEFPGGPEANRVVVVRPVPPATVTPAGANLPTSTRAEKNIIVERARARIREGNYGLGADAYISFWTCGRIKRVSDAVDRMLVIFAGDPELGNSVPMREGMAEGIGTNVIALSDAVLAADNQDDCVVERLVDMSFHQMTLNTIGSFELRHKASRFLLGLSGLDVCSGAGIPSDPVLAKDPLANQAAPGCATAPLATRFDQQQHGKAPVAFEVDEAGWSARGGAIEWQLDAAKNRALIVIPQFPIDGRATVNATGNAADIAQYEIGYMQTITEDSTIVNYVSGHNMELRVPTPIRDRERLPSTAPWFSSDLKSPMGQTSVASTLMFKQVITELPMVYEDPTNKNKRQPGNVIDTTKRRIHFVNWLIARRKGASLDRFDTHFIVGREFDFTQKVDVLGVQGKGNFDTDVTDTDSSSIGLMQFNGPTPEDLGPADLNIVNRPPAREDAGRVTSFEYRRFIREIIEGLVPPRLGLKHSALTVNIMLDAETGRMILPDASEKLDPVLITSPNIPAKPRAELAREILIRARKRNFLNKPGQPLIVKRDPRDKSTEKFEKIVMEFAPTPDILLIDRPGVKEAMREMWRRTERDEKNKDPRGHSLTIYMDRNGNLRPLIPSIVRGKPPVDIPQADGSIVRIYAEDCGGTSPDLENDTPLGAIHTHPNPATPPSGKDHETASGAKDLCGVQFFIINDGFVMSYDEKSDKIVGNREDVLGE